MAHKVSAQVGKTAQLCALISLRLHGLARAQGVCDLSRSNPSALWRGHGDITGHLGLDILNPPRSPQSLESRLVQTQAEDMGHCLRSFHSPPPSHQTHRLCSLANQTLFLLKQRKTLSPHRLRWQSLPHAHLQDDLTILAVQVSSQTSHSLTQKEELPNQAQQQQHHPIRISTYHPIISAPASAPRRISTRSKDRKKREETFKVWLAANSVARAHDTAA